ncbi:MAG: hypothetical protein HZA49_00545 [Planctomycetes bacterium]|nr:hypothetical protein [Planctomycetota bacterium]
MTKRDFISVFIKIVGTILVTSSIVWIPLVIAKIKILIISLIIFSVILIIGLALILLANKIANKLIPVNKELKIAGGNIKPKDVFVIIMKISWMFSIILALEYFIGLLLFLVIERQTTLIISNLLAIIIGIYFLSGGKHIAGLLFDRKPIQPNPTENSEGSIK